MFFLITILFITMLLYCGIILWLTIGNIFSTHSSQPSKFPSISVIVAIRNGEHALLYLIKDLLAQKYPGSLEFILVDDESEDQTGEIIKNISKKDNRFIYETSKKGDISLLMKKKALDAGIKRANYEWLLFTDADCRVPSTWVRGISRYFKRNNDYVIGYSSVRSGSSLLNKFQSLDYFLLLISARGASHFKHPLACTGQNQAYRKSVFNKVGGFTKINKQIQGDDSLFLNICKKWGNAVVVFADHTDCHVIARQEKTWRSLLTQRIRWSGDANIMYRINFSFYLMLLGFFVLHCALISLFFISIFYPFFFTVLVKFLSIKFSVEFFLYFTGSRQLDKSIDFLEFIAWYIIHIPYIVLMGICSFFAEKISWKGRKLHSLML